MSIQDVRIVENKTLDDGCLPIIIVLFLMIIAMNSCWVQHDLNEMRLLLEQQQTAAIDAAKEE